MSKVESVLSKNHFPHLPPYESPKSGFLSCINPRYHPFIQLMRLDRPKPALYFYLPHVLGSIQAGISLETSPLHLLRVNLVLALGTFFLRGATCTWNDLVDMPFDRQVERTRHRPLARGAMSPTVAFNFATIQAICAMVVLSFLPKLCHIYAVPSIVGWIIYPLGKRVTNYPQFVLGLPMAWGVFMGAVAVGADPFHLAQFMHHPLEYAIDESPMATSSSIAIILLFVANWVYNLYYEVMYSYQDIRDDVKAGVGNVALLLGFRWGKSFMAACAIAEILLIFKAGSIMHASLSFMSISVVGHAITLLIQMWAVELSDAGSVVWWFKNGGYFAGGALLSGYTSEYCLRV